MFAQISNERSIYLIFGATVVIGSIGIIKMIFRWKRTQKRKSYAPNVVILHQFPPAKNIPSLSPFCLKLETWY